MSTLHETVDELLAGDGHSIESSDIEVGGVKIVEIKDKKGRVWAVPADDDNVDINEGGLRNRLAIPNPEPDFYYQYITSEQLGDYLGRQFALVEPDEVGLPANLTEMADAVIGTRPASHHQVGNLHLVKIPKLLEQRYRRAEKMRADEAVAGIKVPRHLGKPVEGDNYTPIKGETPVQVHSRKTETVKGKPIVTKNPGFQEYPPETT